MKGTVIIPAYRPPNNLPAFLDELIHREYHRIILIDDGSGKTYQDIFDRCRFKGVTVLSHSKNKGKGEALKTAFEYCMKSEKNSDYIITADCDGQHRIDDIEKLFYTIKANDNAIVLGARNFDKEMPLKSRIGNETAARLFNKFYHLDLCDTQTGLRAFPASMLPQLIRIPGKRYEYETNVLIYAVYHHIPIKTAKINSIYIEKNKHSHYRPVMDSLRVTAAIATHVYKKI